LALLEPIFALAVGLLGLLFVSRFAVGGSLEIARRLGWPPWVAGVLLLALGTSLPELFVIAEAASAYPGLALATVMGSNAFNVGIVLGLLLLLFGDPQLGGERVRKILLSILLVGSVVACLCFTGSEIPTWSSPLFFILYGAAVLRLVLSNRGNPPLAQEEEDPPLNPFYLGWRVWPVTLASFALLAVSAHFFLDGSLVMAGRLGWTEGLAGFLIVAVGTSAPELFTSFQAIREGKPGAVYGNILGSNLFNLLLAGGLVGILQGPRAMIEPGSLDDILTVNLVATLALGLLALLVGFKVFRTQLPRLIGALLLLGYFLAATQALSG
jgi:cation:H+ antiporter